MGHLIWKTLSVSVYSVFLLIFVAPFIHRKGLDIVQLDVIGKFNKILFVLKVIVEYVVKGESHWKLNKKKVKSNKVEAKFVTVQGEVCMKIYNEKMSIKIKRRLISPNKNAV